MRIFDSMVFEDETNEEMSMAVTARGDLNSQQSREVLPLDFNKKKTCFKFTIQIRLIILLRPMHAPRSAAMGPYMTQFQNAGVGLASAPAGNGDHQPPPPKEKKKPPLARQIATKISAGSARLTEVMAWRAKVQDCTTMSSS